MGEADLRLLEKDALLRVYAAGKESSSHVQDALSQHGGVLGDGDGVQVGDAVEHRPRLLLQAHPALNGAQVVAEVGGPRGLDAGEDSSQGIFLEEGETNTFAPEQNP